MIYARINVCADIYIYENFAVTGPDETTAGGGRKKKRTLKKRTLKKRSKRN